MGAARSLVAGAAVAGAALALYVRRRHRFTGQGYADIIKQLPSDARRWATQTRERAAKALEEGRTAARLREDELTMQLEAAKSPSGVLA
jgi:hypothetical protein